MADLDGVNSADSSADGYGIGVPVETKPFFLKGANDLDWGMKDRLSRMFCPKSGKTVMLAFDHGYFMGPTSKLERIDLAIRPLAEYADVLMCARGALRGCIPPTYNKAISLRCSGGISVLTELSNEIIAVNIEDAVRLNASAMAIQVHIGGQYERNTIDNLVKTVDAGMKYGVPTLAVTAVGREMVRDQRYLGLATRICAEMGAQFVKTYYCDEGFEKVTAGCPVPIVIAGGKKLPELDALKMCRRAIDEGALGVDMGRNIFQSDAPVAILKAVRAVVHEGQTPEKAFEMYETLKNEQ